jgi:SAM domain (Sterile alpha motif)
VDYPTFFTRTPVTRGSASTRRKSVQGGREGFVLSKIEDWLQELGMAEHAPRFAENYIDTSVLLDLTHQDPKDLNVPLGRRRKMLRSIAKLHRTTLPPPQQVAAAPAKQDSAELWGAEMRIRYEACL